MLNVVVIFLAVAIDQISKFLITYYHDIHLFSKDIIPNFLRFTYITNEGIAFGLNPFGQYSFILLAVSIIAVLFVVKILIDSQHESKLIQLSLSLIIGGALGNLIDRFFTTFNLMSYNGVIDFIDIGIKEYRFYIFNFADFFISLGIILYLISFIKSKIINE
jgi:signal peptidase II